MNTYDDTLVRFIGVLENEIKTVDKELKNPFKWLQRGFKTVFSLPIYLLNWFAIINDDTVSKISKNFIYNIVTGILGLITFLSGVVTIIQGRDETVQFLRTLFDKGTSP